MSQSPHAIELLAGKDAIEVPSVCVAFGDESFLKQRVLTHLRSLVLDDDDAEFSYTAFEGRSARLPDVLEELSTIAMFGGSRRFVAVLQADEFVTRFRPELEDYAAKPRGRGVLLLEVKSWPKNTRLAKAVAKSGLTVDCGTPKEPQLRRWVVDWAKRVHKLKVDPAAAEHLVDLVGTELGLLDQELAKLALATPSGESVAPTDVDRLVGAWRSKTAWEMIDAALAGDAATAIGQLDRLLLAGESPLGVLAQVSFTLRRLAAATRIILHGEATGRRVPLSAALNQAGIQRFVLQKSEQQLKRLGRHRGQRLLDWILRADLDMKGDSRIPPRQILERLLVQLASPELKSPDAAERLTRAVGE